MPYYITLKYYFSIGSPKIHAIGDENYKLLDMLHNIEKPAKAFKIYFRFCII